MDDIKIKELISKMEYSESKEEKDSIKKDILLLKNNKVKK